MPEETRRDALKIIGAIGATCAFPFGADELYGQHAHPEGAEAPLPQAPRFFTPAEFRVVSRVADLIIPATDTPGALAAGVPAYIDFVVSSSRRHETIYRDGLAWLAERDFLALTEEQQIALLEPLSRAAAAGRIESPAEIFFQSIKSMTADGYYTSRTGLVTELGYRGNTVLARFPECTIPEH